jgi:hypothetical protein
MASKDLCAVCEKPFYGKQKFIRCGECDSCFHCNCLQSDVSESNVIASTGKSAYKCENCKKQASDSTNEQSVNISNQKEVLSEEAECIVLYAGDTDSLSLQLEAIRANGICTMEMVQSLIVTVSELGSEVQQLRMDVALKTQLRDYQQAPTHVPSIQRVAVSSAIANNATAKSYRDVVCAAGGNPGATAAVAPALGMYYLRQLL